jgi:hypothetical protein
MPRVVKEVIQAIAQIKKTTPKAMIEAVEKNFLELIRDDPWLQEIQGRARGSWSL